MQPMTILKMQRCRFTATTLWVQSFVSMFAQCLGSPQVLKFPTAAQTHGHHIEVQL